MFPTTKTVQIQFELTAEDFGVAFADSTKEFPIDDDWTVYAESEFESGDGDDVLWIVHILKKDRGNYTSIVSSVEIVHDDFYYPFTSGMVDTFDDQLPMSLITSPQCVTLNIHITEHMAFRI